MGFEDQLFMSFFAVMGSAVVGYFGGALILYCIQSPESRRRDREAAFGHSESRSGEAS